MSSACSECGAAVPKKRKQLGYTLCTQCGEVAAQAESIRRKSCMAPAYNKGAYQYVATKADAKRIGR